KRDVRQMEAVHRHVRGVDPAPAQLGDERPGEGRLADSRSAGEAEQQPAVGRSGRSQLRGAVDELLERRSELRQHASLYWVAVAGVVFVWSGMHRAGPPSWAAT